eukprot:CAMPEP_0115848092 /NCGR_PEP_ID=MMETSP0287-20121206/10732_1 /TAXON_ID=412157 /ORGANISM="Chrysochromulina rotalis, Strain UIO044" /LENGTH=258 /DNA_ID=CAMNT_0003301971 /DNA_START=21 /DNA_END=797 /DNA_ORIENTATION=-
MALMLLTSAMPGLVVSGACVYPHTIASMQAQMSLSMCGSEGDLEAEAAFRSTMQDLNAAPCFALVDSEEKILQLERDGSPLVLFFADIDRAMLEVDKGRRSTPSRELTVQPVGLGNAYDQVRQGIAAIVPGDGELNAANGMQLAAPEDALGMLASAGIAPPVVEFPNDVLPLFGCAKMTRRRPDGSRFLPLFMSSADAQKSFDAAMSRAPDGKAPDGFEIDVFELPKMVKLAVEGKPIRVIPPTQSMLYLQGKYPDTA